MTTASRAAARLTSSSPDTSGDPRALPGAAPAARLPLLASSSLVSICAGVSGGGVLGALRQPSSVSGTGQFQQWTPAGGRGGGKGVRPSGVSSRARARACIDRPRPNYQRLGEPQSAPMAWSFSVTASQLRPGWRRAHAMASSLEMRRPVAQVKSSATTGGARGREGEARPAPSGSGPLGARWQCKERAPGARHPAAAGIAVAASHRSGRSPSRRAGPTRAAAPRPG
jgi:hypothetical protein